MDGSVLPQAVTGAVLQELGPFGSPTGLLVALVAFAIVLLVGRMLLKLAWRLVMIAILVIGGLYVLGMLGYSVGVF